MVNRFRHLGDRQLTALYLLMEALPKGKKAVHLSSGVLQYLLGVERVHTQRVRELSSSFTPFLSGFKIHDVPGYTMCQATRARSRSFCRASPVQRIQNH
jgi:hypothetical protein